jgi:membrane-associated progesterone receptor component
MDANSIVLVIAAGIVSYFVLTTIRILFEIFFPSKVTAKGYQPQQVGELTLEEMSKCTGDDPFRPILVAVKGNIYDVTEARNFYGPGGAYHVYAGREAARALGKMSLDESECTGELDDLTEKEKTTLEQWESKFSKKYKVVGQVRRINNPEIMVNVTLKQEGITLDLPPPPFL